MDLFFIATEVPCWLHFSTTLSFSIPICTVSSVSFFILPTGLCQRTHNTDFLFLPYISSFLYNGIIFLCSLYCLKEATTLKFLSSVPFLKKYLSTPALLNFTIFMLTFSFFSSYYKLSFHGHSFQGNSNNELYFPLVVIKTIWSFSFPLKFNMTNKLKY